VLTTMAGTAAAALRDNHIRIEFFLAAGSPARQRALALFGAGITAVFFLVLAALTGRMAWDDFHYNEISMGLGVPRWWYSAWVPALSVVIALRTLQFFRQKL
jgi:TRAP-type C4-dicarboxylate transport system permease small subunit